MLVACCNDPDESSGPLEFYLCQHICRNGDMQHNSDLSNAISNLLQQVLKVLTGHMYIQSPLYRKPARPESPQTIGSSCMDALTTLLCQLQEESFPGKSDIVHQWFRANIAQFAHSMGPEDLSAILFWATKMLRTSEDTVISSGLDQLTAQLCQTASNMPPIAAVDASDTQQQAVCADILTNIADAFFSRLFGFEPHPAVWEAHQAWGASTAAERQALLTLVKKQVQAEASVARAAAASRRADDTVDTPASAEKPSRYICGQTCRSLMHATSWCWSSFPQPDTVRLYSHKCPQNMQEPA